jgi:hypothetical protein
MGLVTYVPFGRGRISAASHLSTPYETLKTLSTVHLDWRNFHPQAGISETYLVWDRHNHQDGTLGLGVIRDNHLKRVTGAENCQVLNTQAPKTLMLFGSYMLYGSGWGEPFFIEFASTSYARQAFSPGTIPQVMASFYVGASLHSGFIGASAWVTGITSQGFMFSGIWLDDANKGDFGTVNMSGFTVTYCAVGAAPGYLDPLER